MVKSNIQSETKEFSNITDGEQRFHPLVQFSFQQNLSQIILSSLYFTWNPLIWIYIVNFTKLRRIIQISQSILYLQLTLY